MVNTIDDRAELILALECDVASLSAFLVKTKIPAESVRQVVAAHDKDLALYAIPIDESAVRMVELEVKGKELPYQIHSEDGIRRGGFEHKAKLFEANYLIQN